MLSEWPNILVVPLWDQTRLAHQSQATGDRLSCAGSRVGQLLTCRISETGKSLCDAALEIPLALQLISYYGRHGAKFLRPEKRRSSTVMFANKRVSVVRTAQPLVGIISPWNYPLANPLMDAIPAPMAGSAVLIKPSELTPVTIGMVAEGWKKLGGPEVFAIVQGGRDIGESVIDEVDFVQFTGSSRTGTAVLERAARSLTPVSLELGGKDPMIVLEDADIERATPRSEQRSADKERQSEQQRSTSPEAITGRTGCQHESSERQVAWFLDPQQVSGEYNWSRSTPIPTQVSCEEASTSVSCSAGNLWRWIRPRVDRLHRIQSLDEPVDPKRFEPNPCTQNKVLQLGLVAADVAEIASLNCEIFLELVLVLHQLTLEFVGKSVHTDDCGGTHAQEQRIS